jgi:hypothetical protein
MRAEAGVPKKRKSPETDELASWDDVCGGPPHECTTVEDESFILWATSEVLERSCEIYEEMRVAETVWDIHNGKLVRVSNPLLEMNE